MAMATAGPSHNAVAGANVPIRGCTISDFSRHVVQAMAQEARLPVVYITSAARTVPDQARIFYNKHVVGKTEASYHNPAVKTLLGHARELRDSGTSERLVKSYLIEGIENVHGGPISVSRHLGATSFCEVFDVAHYSVVKGKRSNSMTSEQANAFLAACRKRLVFPIQRLGHSKELGYKNAAEFHDEMCFHIEMLQPVYDRLERSDTTTYA